MCVHCVLFDRETAYINVRLYKRKKYSVMAVSSYA